VQAGATLTKTALLPSELFAKPQEAPRRSTFRQKVKQLAADVRSRVESKSPFLVAASMRESLEAAPFIAKRVHVQTAEGLVPRPYAVAQAYLSAAPDGFRERDFIEFVNTHQAASPFSMAELSDLNAALLIVLLERHVEGDPLAEDSMRRVADAIWEDIFESVSFVERILEQDPAGYYAGMEERSRQVYRIVIGRMGERSRIPETEIANEALRLASSAPEAPEHDREQFRRRHIGYYLVDEGRPQLEKLAGFRPRVSERVARWILASPTGFYLVGVELVTFLVVVFLLSGLPSLTPILGGLALLLLPATHAAVAVMNGLASALVLPRVLPKLEFNDEIPEQYSTVVAVPVLLSRPDQVRNLVRDLEIRYLANPERNLYYGLLSDLPDAQADENEEKNELVTLVCGLIDELNDRYGDAGNGPFFLLHRFRAYNASEGAFIGWERKRGKLLDLNAYLQNAGDAFPVKAGATDAIQGAKYVITLDSDTQLPPGAAARLVGTMAHPLNRAVIDEYGQVTAGYGIIQPRVSVSVQSAARSRLAQVYSGQTGFDIYTRAVSDTYQDVFGEGIYTGKGIYEVDIFRKLLERRFPINRLLSHDLMEGLYARTALTTDIEVVDDYPSHYSAYSRRQHRWIRGDWQVLRWLLPVVPDSRGRMIANPISLIARWKITDNARRSLIRPATLLLLLAGWFALPGPPGYWTLAVVTLLLIPTYAQLLFIPLQPFSRPTRRSLAHRLGVFLQEHVAVVLELTFLIEQSLSSLDAIIRSLVRVRFTRRKLLEWETAADAEQGKRRAPVDLYLQLSPVISLAITALMTAYATDSVPEAAPILVLWGIAPACSRWLNSSPKGNATALSTREQERLHDLARKTWGYFDDFSNAENNFLIPDSAQQNHEVDHRLSPTNLGLLLNSRIAGVEFGFLGIDRFIDLTRKTLNSMVSMEKQAGHFYNWYDCKTLKPMQPFFISTVDSGNLAVCLWTLKQACLSWREKTDGAEAAALAELAAVADSLVTNMDFRLLYRADRKVLSIGFDCESRRCHAASYDLLASEARLAVFVAIALGQIPHKAWLHLGRTHTEAAGTRVLVSWSGTAFEYLMPALWMKPYDRTLLSASMEAMLKVQRSAAGPDRPWGTSECAYGASEGSVQYGPCGLPDVAMQPGLFSGPVVSPYSTLLGMVVNARAAFDNMDRMEKMGWLGEYGFFEAADYSHMREDMSASYSLVRSWMAHHQGMSLLAMANVLHDNVFQRLFHMEPRVEACERLLHEKLPPDVPVVKMPTAPKALPEPCEEAQAA